VFSQIRKMLIVLEGPEHIRLRKLLMPSFTPKALAVLAPMIGANTEELIKGLAGRDRIDMVEDFCYPLTVRTICSMLGVPPSDDQFCHERTNRHLRVHEPDITEEELFELNKGEIELAEYFREHVRERRSRALDKLDVISLLAHFEVDGDSLSDDEIVANIVLLYLGGEDTNANLLANSAIALLDHPDQAALVREDPKVMDAGFDELLRWDSSLQFHPRVVADDAVEYGGQTMNPGEMVFCLLGSAHRDPSQFDDPDRLDLTRRIKRPIGFGGGLHRCLGAQMAQLQTSIALPAFFRAFPNLSRATDQLDYDQIFLRGPNELPLSLGDPVFA